MEWNGEWCDACWWTSCKTNKTHETKHQSNDASNAGKSLEIVGNQLDLQLQWCCNGDGYNWNKCFNFWIEIVEDANCEYWTVENEMNSEPMGRNLNVHNYTDCH